MSDVFATCEVVESVFQVLKYWDSQHKSSWLYGYTLHATAPGVSTWPSRLCDQARYLEILTLFFSFFFWRVNHSGFLFWWSHNIVLKCRWSPCSPKWQEHIISSIWRLVKYDNLTPPKFVASTCPKRNQHGRVLSEFLPPGSDLGSCVGSKLGYMKAPKNMTLEKYLNISFPAPIRKQKKSTWSFCLFLCLYDRSVCKCLIAMQRHLKVESPFAGHFSIFFLCGWCALCTSHWWTPVQFFRQWLNFVVWFTACSFDYVRLTSIIDTWMLFIFVGCALLSDFLEFHWSCQFEMLFGDSAKPTQSDFGHPMTSLDPCQSSEDEGNVCKSASNSSRMHVEV